MSLDTRLKRLEVLLRTKAKGSDVLPWAGSVSEYVAAHYEVFGSGGGDSPDLRAWRDHLAGVTGAPPLCAEPLLAIAPLDILRKIEESIERLDNFY